ncbi:MAG: putrescine/spermidine ABC transporter permease, partial [Mesorhizobium sp.]
MARLSAAFIGRLVIIIPYLWLVFFFLIPFIIVFKISLSQTAIAIPPYTPVLDFGDGLSGFLAQLKQLSIDNYTWLTQDALYFNAYVTSV